MCLSEADPVRTVKAGGCPPGQTTPLPLALAELAPSASLQLCVPGAKAQQHPWPVLRTRLGGLLALCALQGCQGPAAPRTWLLGKAVRQEVH